MFSFIPSCTLSEMYSSFFSPRMFMILHNPNHKVSFYSLFWSASNVGCLMIIVNIEVPKS